MYSPEYQRHAHRQILYAICAPEALPALMAPFGNREPAYATRHLIKKEVVTYVTTSFFYNTVSCRCWQ